MSDLLFNILLIPAGLFLFLISQIFQVAGVNRSWELSYDMEAKIYSISVAFLGLAIAIWFVVDNWK
mgnify:CR=1 FL=1